MINAAPFRSSGVFVSGSVLCQWALLANLMGIDAWVADKLIGLAAAVWFTEVHTRVEELDDWKHEVSCPLLGRD